MIFVTVGTHEQPFNRLLRCIDEMAEKGLIEEKVVVQKGYSSYVPKHCDSYDFIGYTEMQNYIKEARIVITHGGPASFISPLSIGKIPIVVPRKKEFNEHVNNHQLDFAREVETRKGNILVAETDDEIKDCILNYDKKSSNLNKNNISNNEKFNENLIKEIEKIL